MKRRSVQVILALSFLILADSLFLAAQPETKSVSPLESLLDGSSVDLSSTLSSLNDTDLPLALAVAEALKFKVLHGDTKISLDDVEGFQRSIEKRFEEAKTISLAKSEVCHIPVPSRKVSLGGLELSVPACFRAEQPLQIINFGPQGEAGSPFPEVWVEALSDCPPVQTRMTVDGKPVSLSSPAPGNFLFRPAVSPAGLFSIGTHTAEVSLTDVTGRGVSKTWCFTVGLEAVAALGIPSDAELVGSFTITMKTLFPGATVDGDVLVRVFLTRESLTICEYSLFTVKGAKFPAIRTTSLFLLRDFGKRTIPSYGNVFIKPTTPFIFEGYDLVTSQKRGARAPLRLAK